RSGSVAWSDHSQAAGACSMRSFFRLLTLFSFGATASVWFTVSAGADEGAGSGRVSVSMRVIETPDGGIQPQAAIDDQGVIHLIYFQGDPSGGDLFYRRLELGAERFSQPVRVNSQAGSAIAIGTIRGGQIALGKGGRIHVAWNGATGAQPKNPFG